jgi:hypothetical protein
MSEKFKKKWPMPKDVHDENWGPTKAENNKTVDDTREKIQSDQDHNAKIIKRQTPHKWG